jgi:hypothetical protein
MKKATLKRLSQAIVQRKRAKKEDIGPNHDGVINTGRLFRGGLLILPSHPSTKLLGN